MSESTRTEALKAAQKKYRAKNPRSEAQKESDRKYEQSLKEDAVLVKAHLKGEDARIYETLKKLYGGHKAVLTELIRFWKDRHRRDEK